MLLGLVSKRILESLHLTDGHELKIISRGRPFAYRWQTAYGTDVCSIPFKNVVDATWIDNAGSAAAVDLVLKTSGGACTYAFARDNPSIEHYAALLAVLPTLKAMSLRSPGVDVPVLPPS